MHSPRQKAEAELDRIKRHLKSIGRASYRHLHPYINRVDRVVIYYTRTQPQTEIKAHPIKDPAGFHAEYWQIRNGGPTDGGTASPMRRPEGSHAEGTWNAAFDVIEKSNDLKAKMLNTRRAYASSLKTCRTALGNLPMAKTKPYLIGDFIDACAANGQNVVNVWTVLKKAYAIGHQREWLTRDLLAGIKLPTKKQREDAPKYYKPFEDWQVDLWRANYEIGTTARFAFEWAYNQGLPRSDLVRIAPCHIGRNENGELVIEGFARRKTGKKFHAVISSPELIACIEAHAPAGGEVVDRLGRSTTPFLRKQRSGEPYVAGHLINDDAACQRAADQLGSDWTRWRAKVPQIGEFRLHAGRHTIAKDSTFAEISRDDAKWVLGQTDKRTFDRYVQERDAEIGGHRASRGVAAYREGKRLKAGR